MNFSAIKLSKIVSVILLASSLQIFSFPTSAQAATDPSGSISFPNTYGSTPNKTVSIVSAGLGPGTGAFTYELWFKNNMDSSTNTTKTSTNLIGTRSDGGGATGLGFDLFYDFNNVWLGPSQLEPSVMVYFTSPDTYTVSTGRPSQKQWHHIVFERDASFNAKIFLDGNLVSSGTDSRNFDSTRITLGEKWPTNNEGGFQGNMSNFRYVKGVMVYTGNFTVPTSPLTATQSAGTNISAITAGQTKVLLNTPDSANFLKDYSASNFTMTNNNTVLRSSASPFTLPTVTSLSVTSGAFAGGTSTTISGTNLSSTTGVSVDGVASDTVTVNSSTSVTFITPAGTVGAKDVVVTTAYGTYGLTAAFTYANAQTITFSALGGITIGGAAPALTATASSNLTVSYASTTTGVCTVSGSTITIVATGNCSITASQSGGSGYAAATDVIRSFTVSAVVTAAPTIKFPTLKQPTLKLAVNREVMSWGELAKLTLTGGVESGTVTYENSGDAYCLVDPSTKQVLSTKYGTCIITAYNSGDTDYMQGVSNSIKILVAENTTPELDMNKVSSIYFASGTYYLNASSKSALTKIAAKVKAKNPTEILCYGFTDSKSGADNTYLSKMRAKSVADYLALKGVTTEITLGWYADSKPAVAGVSKAALAKNRRVEIYIK
jgi:outer membrane protein OmpA-like peptidoglycan-associated protein